MIRKRLILMGILFLCGFCALILRLADIQLFSTESFSEQNINLIQKSIEQRTTGFVINNGRGLIVDRNGQALNADEKNALVLFPFLKNTDWPVEKVAEIIGVSPGALKYAVDHAKKPFAYDLKTLTLTDEQKKAVNALGIPGCEVVTIRYMRPDQASYIVGAVGENASLVHSRYPELLKAGIVTETTPVGVIGMEEAFDPFLLSHHEQKLLYHTTATGEPLFGEEVKLSAESESDYYPLKVVSTLDKSLQEMVEGSLDQSGIEYGGVVLLDAETSNLLAMASRPAIDPERPFLHPNYMLTPQYPGSVFKIVTAAAAIQKNILSPEETFNCNQNPYGDGPADRRLGQLDFAESFYQSCNYTFGSLANRLMETDPKVLDKFAAMLGLMQKSGWSGKVFHYEDFKQLRDEGENIIWEDEGDRRDHKAIAQTAIGQRNVKLTPLSVANMMATIARGGEKRSVRVATEIDYNKLPGVTLTTFPQQKLPGQTIDRYTAMKLEQLLRGVVKNPDGTAHSLNDAKYPVAGKSGTAETGHGYTNQWFAGYFPADDPKYVMVVVDLRHQHGNAVYNVYKELVNRLYEKDHTKP